MSNKKTLLQLWGRQKGYCLWCGKKTWVIGRHSVATRRRLGVGGVANIHSLIATIEHVLPKGKGGTSESDNLAMSCRGCNNARLDVSNGLLPDARAAARLSPEQRENLANVIEGRFSFSPDFLK